MKDRTLFSKHNYTRPDIKYIKNTPITEFDMSNAGINILYTYNLLDKDFVNYLNSMDKLTKNITVGKILQNNPEWNKIMMDEFIAIRKYFMEVNDLYDNDILSIKKDALFIINKRVNVLQISDNYIFKEKNNYNTYLKIMNKEFYVDTENSTYDVKGFSKEVLEKQEEYFINFILSSLVISSENDRKELYEHLKTFRSNFLNFNLPKEFYIDLEDGEYKFKYNKNLNNFVLSPEPPSKISDCNIDNNYMYLRELISTLL